MSVNSLFKFIVLSVTVLSTVCIYELSCNLNCVNKPILKRSRPPDTALALSLKPLKHTEQQTLIILHLLASEKNATVF